MGFSRRRGRPTIAREKIDKGTPELQAKRQKEYTTEAIDLCFRKGLIEDYQLDAAIRLRWLYTLNFGAATVSCYDPMKKGAEIKNFNEDWLSIRRKEFDIAMKALGAVNAKRIVLNVSVFNYRPFFLMGFANYKSGRRRISELLKFREGLDILAEVFGKKPGGIKRNTQMLTVKT